MFKMFLPSFYQMPYFQGYKKLLNPVSVNCFKVNTLLVITAWSESTVLMGSLQENLGFHCTAAFCIDQYKLKLSLDGDSKHFQYM